MLRIAVIAAMLAVGCGGQKDTSCKPKPCATPCGAVGYKTDANGCRISCDCNGAPTSCPQLSCSQTCGLGNAQDATTGCPTCSCCYPADCIDGCHATGNDGCPTCVSC